MPLTQKIKHLYNRFASQDNLVLFVAVVLALGILWNTLGALQQNFALQRQVDQLEQEVEVLELENELLAFEQRYLNSQEFLLLSAKERLNKAEPGEKVIILPDVKPIAEENTTRSNSALEPSNFEQWLVFLFGRKSSDD